MSAFRSHSSANFQQILDSFILNFKLNYKDSENMKTDHVDTVVLNLHQSNVGRFLGTSDSLLLSDFHKKDIQNYSYDQVRGE